MLLREGLGINTYVKDGQGCAAGLTVAADL